MSATGQINCDLAMKFRGCQLQREIQLIAIMPNVALGSSQGYWECSLRSNPLTPWVTQDSCGARMYNANPVWQASDASPIDFSSATQPLSSPKQLHSDKC